VTLGTPFSASSSFASLFVFLLGLVPLASLSFPTRRSSDLPPASWTVTFGCVANATPPVLLLDCWVKASLAAGPTVMLKVALVAGAGEQAPALQSRQQPAWPIVRPMKQATPLTAATNFVPDC